MERASIAQLSKYGIPMRIVVHRRPILSAKIPAGKAPAKAPIAIKLPTHDSEKSRKNGVKFFNAASRLSQINYQ